MALTQFYDKVIAILEPLGYRCVAVSMPSVGTVPPVSSLDEDIAAVRNAVMVELDAGRDVIVNAHSWSGIPVNRSVLASHFSIPGQMESFVFPKAFIAPVEVHLLRHFSITSFADS
jgi:hypothetical protein